MVKTILNTLIFLIASPVIWAQQIDIEGTVTDAESGDPLLGVTVKVKDAEKGAVTDFDGKFSLNDVTVGEVLEISSLGYRSQEVTITSQTNYTIALTPDIGELEEVVLIGYGSQKKKEVTGAVSLVDSETIEDQKAVRVEQAIQGRVAGVQVTQQSGSPGGASNIRIRGISTNGDNRPLILLDGAVIEDLSVVNPNDIEDVNIIKDATAGIYGVRAANGVIIITTKSGRKNQALKLNYDGYYGIQTTSRKLPVLNAQEYGLIVNEAYAAAGEELPFPNVSQLGEGTDYQDEVFDVAPMFYHNISANGGTIRATYAGSASIIDQKGIVGSDKSQFTRYTARLKGTYNILDNLVVRANALYTGTERSTLNENGLGSVLFNAVNMTPVLPVRQDGEFSLAEGLGNEVVNPLQQIANTFNGANVDKITAIAGLTYEPLDGLELNVNHQMNYAKVYGDNFLPIVDYGPGKVFNNDVSQVNVYEQFFTDYTFDAFAKYDRMFNERHRLQATLGTSVFRTRGRFSSFTGFDIPDNSYSNATLAQAGEVRNDNPNGDPGFDQRLLSYFARVQYDYDGKYLLTAAVRRDGSTNFSPENRFGYFPSFSVGWILSEEEWFEGSKDLNLLKLRSSFGVLGNDRIGAFQFASLLDGEGTYVFDNALAFGVAEGALGNPSIKWEEQEAFDIGVDAAFFDNKLNITTDFFTRTTRGLLLVPQVSRITGVAAPGSSAPTVNGGDVRNSGLELAISYRDDLNDDFGYEVGINGSYIDNEVLRVDNENGFLEGGAFGIGQLPPSRMSPGKPIGYFYGLQTDGVFQSQAEVDAHPSQIGLGAEAQPGDIRYMDVNGDGMIDFDDRTDIGNPIPDFTFGINLSLDYKDFDFRAYFFGSVGNDIVRNYERNQPLTNRTNRALGRWTGPGTSNSIPRATIGATTNQLFSSYYVEDGSFLRAQNIQLGYTVDKATTERWGFGLSELRTYVAANNLFTLTKYEGYDVTTSNGAPIGQGIDLGFYPNPTTFILGLNLKFF